MKKICIWFVLLFLAIDSHSQNKFGDTWVVGLFGYSVNFGTVPITHDTNYINIPYGAFGKGHSNICDSNANVIISCDGMDAFNGAGTLIDDGDTLVPIDYYLHEQGWSETSQNSIILPMDGKKYYLITPTVSDSYLANVWANKPSLNWNYDLLLYHVIDMNANAGAGKVVQKKLPLLINTPMKKTQMMACRHANGKDWWLLKMAGDSNMVFTFLFKQDSVIKYPNQYIPFPFIGTNDSYGQMQFSQDGKKWATTCNWADDITYKRTGELYVSDFDRCTGILSNFQLFVAPPVSGDSSNVGLSFSPNGKFLYISKNSAIQQLNLNFGTWYTVHGVDSPAYFCGYSSLHLAVDNKIYIGRTDGICKQYSVIDSPDVEINCAFCVNCLRSKSVNGYFMTPPNMPNYELGAELPCWPLGKYELLKLNDELVVWPNPTSLMLNVKCSMLKEKDNKCKIEMYSAVGQLILSTTKDEVDVQPYPKGMYYIKVGTAVKKVVIE